MPPSYLLAVLGEWSGRSLSFGLGLRGSRWPCGQGGRVLCSGQLWPGCNSSPSDRWPFGRVRRMQVGCSLSFGASLCVGSSEVPGKSLPGGRLLRGSRDSVILCSPEWSLEPGSSSGQAHARPAVSLCVPQAAREAAPGVTSDLGSGHSLRWRKEGAAN